MSCSNFSEIARSILNGYVYRGELPSIIYSDVPNIYYTCSNSGIYVDNHGNEIHVSKNGLNFVLWDGKKYEVINYAFNTDIPEDITSYFNKINDKLFPLQVKLSAYPNSNYQNSLNKNEQQEITISWQIFKGDEEQDLKNYKGILRYGNIENIISLDINSIKIDLAETTDISLEVENIIDKITVYINYPMYSGCLPIGETPTLHNLNQISPIVNSINDLSTQQLQADFDYVYWLLIPDHLNIISAKDIKTGIIFPITLATNINIPNYKVYKSNSIAQGFNYSIQLL